MVELYCTKCRTRLFMADIVEEHYAPLTINESGYIDDELGGAAVAVTIRCPKCFHVRKVKRW